LPRYNVRKLEEVKIEKNEDDDKKKEEENKNDDNSSEDDDDNNVNKSIEEEIDEKEVKKENEEITEIETQDLKEIEEGFNFEQFEKQMKDKIFFYIKEVFLYLSAVETDSDEIFENLKTEKNYKFEEKDKNEFFKLFDFKIITETLFKLLEKKKKKIFFF
jgi:hypothetical protein